MRGWGRGNLTGHKPLAARHRKEETGDMTEEDPAQLVPLDSRALGQVASTAPGTGHASQPHPAQRAGDEDRDQVVTLLREHCAEGRLTLDEFSERTGTALAARTKAELDNLLFDLPKAANTLACSPPRRPRRWIVAVMSDLRSKERLRLSGHSTVVALMGRCEVDLSRAEIDGPEIVITALGIMGEIDIIAPEGIEVDVTGLSIMGTRSVSVPDVPVLSGAPRILVRAFPIMGEVRVKSRARSNGRLPKPTS
jgi:hypothetical protein